jgi:cupin superfamily acireductone dioxygenase involved in methionine salvage
MNKWGGKMRYLLITLMAITFVGCSDTWICSGNKYQIMASTDGNVYRLDGKTGEVMIISKGTMHKISQSEQTLLVVNGLYKTEDGEIILYLGKSKFGARPLPTF